MPVEDVVIEVLDPHSINISWTPDADSKHNFYLVQYRPVLRDPAALWRVNSTYNPWLALTHLFPGERYELAVSAGIETVFSDNVTDSVVMGM